MYVVKRNGRQQPVFFDKITARIRKLSWGLSTSIDVICIAKKVIEGVYNGVRTCELDELSAQTAASMITSHPDYGILAARIAVSNLHKNTDKLFSNVIQTLYKNTNLETNEASPMIDDKIYKIVEKYKDKLNDVIIYDRDYNYDYFGIKTLIKSYLFKINNKIIERPQHLLMRVSLGIHGNDIDAVIESYNLMSLKYFTHASPTLFNAATPKPQMSSCFLLSMKHDSIEGIYDTVKQCAVISKHAGGIGLSIHNIRAKGSYIKGTNGRSNGLVPMLRVFNNTARYVDQGGGKRKGSFAIYLEPWHPDIFDFISLKKNHGKEEERCRDLFFALWIPDLFMIRVKNDELWSLMCPDQCKGLENVYGDIFNKLYCKYEQEKKYKEQIKARSLWSAILYSQMETGQPFMCYKDHCNKKSNQMNLGTIKSSNLCTEIMEYTANDEIAVCNLASIALPKFVDIVSKTFDFDKLISVTSVVTKNLNKIIDLNYYPLEECRNSNLRHRPIGIGVQGLADVFILLRVPFDSDHAKKLNKDIFEAIYYGACKTSNQLAMKYGAYKTFKGSPASKGLLQFDLWDNVKININKYKWNELKDNICKYGLRNSLLTAPMPTASTSQILGNNECFEPYTSNVYIRRTLAGEFVVINKHLLRDLIKLGIWNNDIKNKLIANNGSVQYMDEIPSDLKALYKTVWEIKQKEIINMAVDRGAFIDQSQSLNIHLSDINYGKLTSMHFYGWKKGLKTGMYYLRTKPAVDAIKFTICPIKIDKIKMNNNRKKQINGKQINGKQINRFNQFYHDDVDDMKLNINNKNKMNNNNDNDDDDDDYKEDVDEYKIIDNKKKEKKNVATCSRYNKEECLMCGS